MVDERIIERLKSRGVAFCLIGAAALSKRGFARFSADIDLLTVDRGVLSPRFWEGVGLETDVRHGDPSDPLQGVVRWHTDPPVDLVVGRGHAARLAIETAEVMPGEPVRIPTALALVLNKLEAGGPLDSQDVLNLVAVHKQLNGAPWLADVAAHLPQLSPEAQALWTRLLPELARL